MYVRIEKIKMFYRIFLLFNEIFIYIMNNGWYVYMMDRIIYNDLKVCWCGNRNYKIGDYSEV